MKRTMLWEKIGVALLSLVLLINLLPIQEAHAEEYPKLDYYEIKDLQGIYDIADNAELIKHISLETNNTAEKFDDSYYKIKLN